MLGVFIETLSWLQAEAALKECSAVVIPIGAGCKEHGRHLPLNTDRILAEYIAGRVAERCRVVVLPTVVYGYYPSFTEYPGSVSIGAAAFRDTVADICRSFSRHGAKNFYAINTGISTAAPLGEAAAALAPEGTRFEYTDWHAAAAEARRAVEEQPRGTHADEIETSMMLYVAPDVVRMDLARPELALDRAGPLTREPRAAGVYSQTGAWGDPTLANREKGRFMVETVVAHIVQTIEREFRR